MARAATPPAPGGPAAPGAARWFIALQPPAATTKALAGARDALHDAVSDGRPVATGRLHLTLAFIGTGPRNAGDLARVQVALDGLDAGAFDLVLDRIGSFQVGHRHVGWIGPRVSPAALVGLVDGIRARLVAHDVPVDPRPFVPHVTVLRGLAAPPAARPIAPIRWPVDRFDLMASRLDASRYETVASWRLPARGQASQAL